MRSAEFEKAHAQATTLTISLMVLAAIAAALTSLNLFGLKMLWAVLAVIFPVLSTAIAAYDNLYAFDRQIKLYRDASQALQSARADAPDLDETLSETDYAIALKAYVDKVEKILRTEQGQWGQLINELKLPEPPRGADNSSKSGTDT